MRARIAFAALLASTCFSAPFVALAAPGAPAAPGAVEEASQHFQKGVQLFKESNFDAALAEFRKAYQLAPSYRVLYNIAQVQYDLHNYVETLKAFRQYLAEGGSEIPSERRLQVEAEVRKVEGRVGYIEITSNVEGAQVSLDEVPVGTLPLRIPLMVNPGTRRVSVTKIGYGTTARIVTIAGGDRAQVQLDMTELTPARAQHDDGKKGATTSLADIRPHRPRTAMWVSLAATGALGITAGVFGVVSRGAKRDFESELSTYPNTKDQIDDARSRLALTSGLADGFAAAAVVAGGFTIYFALSGGGSSSTASAPPPKRIGFAPMPGGLVAVGQF